MTTDDTRSRRTRQSTIPAEKPSASSSGSTGFGGSAGVVATITFACSSPSTTSAPCALDRLLRAGRVHPAADVRELVRNLRQLLLPLLRGQARRGQLLELLGEKDEPKQVAEDQPLLLREVLARDVGVEVAVVDDLVRGPHALRYEVAHFRVLRVEQQPRLVRQAGRALVPRHPLLFFLHFALRLRHFGDEQPLGDQLRVELLGLQRSRCQVPRHAHELQQRTWQFQHAFQKLKPLLAVGDAEEVDEERPVQRVTRPEHEQLVKFGRGRRGEWGVARSLIPKGKGGGRLCRVLRGE